MPKKMTQKEFVKRAKEIHGDKYDYTKVEYKNSITPICIICPIHGEFLQKPNNHINQKQGCPKCSHQSYPTTQEEFIEKARKVHGDKYDYSKVEYKNNKTKVCIICPEHGEFWVRPDNFIHGSGCFKCSIRKKPQCIPWDTELFIEKARKVHGDKYTYEKVIYKNYEEKIIVTCTKHGDFLVTPDNFLHGHGCPICKESTLEKEIRELLIENNINFEEQKMFDWLKYKNKMKLDFYLPDYNTAIECQGGQHFEVIDYFGGEDDYKKRQKRDLLKKELCKENDIKILYYSNIKEKINDNIINNKKTLLKRIYENNFDCS